MAAGDGFGRGGYVLTPKYFARIRELAARPVETGAFDFSELGGGGGLVSALARNRTVHALLRTICPVGRIGRFGWVVRYADVSDVRRRSSEFIAPYGEEMVQLTGKKNFLLGLEDGPDYQRQLGFMRQVMRQDDVERLIAPNAASLSRELIDCCGGEIDAVEDLLFRVAAETCADYFGLEIDDPIAFSQWLMSLSALLFADYFGNEDTHRLARAGAKHIRHVIDGAITRVRTLYQSQPPAGHPAQEQAARQARSDDTLVGRLMRLQLANPATGPDDDDIRAILMGTAVGYVPTGGGAGGNILNELLDRPEWLESARKAAVAGDDAVLGKILGEAMRFAPPIDPGLPRYVKRTAKVGSVTFPEGSTLLVASKSAMFDGRAVDAPERFNPDRDLSGDLQFGGEFLHYCVGEQIARALLLEAFKPLLRQARLRRAPGGVGRLTTVGPFPQHLKVVFEPTLGHRLQSMITICVEVTEPVPASEIDKEIERLGNPAQPAIREALNSTNRIHFAHISAIAGDVDASGRTITPTYVLVELTADGETDSAIDALVAGAGVHLMRVFTLATGVATNDALGALLKRCTRRLVSGRVLPWPSTASGLDFPGTPELSIPQIERDRETAALASKLLDTYIASRASRGGLASPAIEAVREGIRTSSYRARLCRATGQDQAVSRRTDRNLGETLGALLTDREILGTLLITLGATLLIHFLLDSRTYSRLETLGDLAGFLGVSLRASLSLAVGAAASLALFALTHWIGFKPRLTSRTPLDQRISESGLTLTALALVLGVAHFALFQNEIGAPAWDAANLGTRLILVLRVTSEIASSLIFGLVVYVFLVAVAISLFLFMLRRSEITGLPQDDDPPHDHVDALLKRENPAGYVQNHLIAVTPLKTNPRWLRRFTLGLAFFGIRKLVEHRFRPGFVLDIGTIHFARWFRLPKTDKLVFLSNYDGSWESYLEDFITKAHLGQSAVWSNGVGFPETRFLINGGASDGARFKRWVRRQQRESRFWYSRFPKLTTDQMRNNGLICDGLAKARTESEAQAWLDLFGSRPRPRYAMEHEEIQTLVFSGMPKLLSGEIIPLRIPDDNAVWPTWLLSLLGADETGNASAWRIAFGQAPPHDCALTLALSAEGMRRCGLGDLAWRDGGKADGTTLDSFPDAFIRGMSSAERARMLGDLGESAPASWPWAREGGMPHLVLMLYAANDAVLKTHAAHLRKQLADDLGFSVLPSIRMKDRATGHSEIDYEPFGFRDGLSQPIIRGTRPVRGPGDAMHVVEPGEFVLGYPDNRGDTPPTPVVAAEYDRNILPNLIAYQPGRFPDFKIKDEEAPRDFGRNGSFLVIRQLEQDVAGFHAQAERAATMLRSMVPGVHVNRAWVEAKMVGRWHDGSPLVRHPSEAGGVKAGSNDFMFGAEDPQGLRCPYGAHIRRAFPRDSLSPDSPDQLSISNRHRLLRRGRPYVAPGEPATAPARGLIFMCLNADIERQFEFVQQTWIGSSGFHGMADQADPIAASRSEDEQALRTEFTIPTTLGPVRIPELQSFVTVRNGGYFFLPSWSALRFLASRPPVRSSGVD